MSRIGRFCPAKDGPDTGSVGAMDTTQGNAERPWLHVHEVAAHEGVCAETVRRWVRAGAIPAERNPGGRTLRIPRDYAARIAPQAGQ